MIFFLYLRVKKQTMGCKGSCERKRFFFIFKPWSWNIIYHNLDNHWGCLMGQSISHQSAAVSCMDGPLWSISAQPPPPHANPCDAGGCCSQGKNTSMLLNVHWKYRVSMCCTDRMCPVYCQLPIVTLFVGEFGAC